MEVGAPIVWHTDCGVSAFVFSLHHNMQKAERNNGGS